MIINTAVSRVFTRMLLILICTLGAGVCAHAAGPTDAGIDRVNLYVSDLDRAMTFYGGVLGFEAGAVTTHEPDSFVHAAIGLDPDTPVRDTLLRSGDDQAVIGLVEARGAASSNPLGAAAVSVEVRSLDSVIAGAESLGLTILDEHTRVNATGQPIRQRVVVDWDGNRIALYFVGAAAARIVDDCVIVGDLVSWKVFDDRQIYIEGNEAGARLLLTTRARCRGALYTRLFEIPNGERRLCKTGSRIAYLDAGLRRTCRVESFELVPDMDEAALRARDRRSAAQYQ